MPIVHADLSQAELRVATVVWPDSAMIEDINSGDPHARTVTRLMDLGYLHNAAPDTRRTKAKNVNFGVLYLSGGQEIAAEVGATVAEMEEIVAGHKRIYPEFHAAQAADMAKLRAQGFIETITGMPHRIALTGRVAVDNAIIRSTMNALVQGPSAQYVKLAQAMIHTWIEEQLRPKGYRVQLYNNVHDAIDLDSPTEELGVVIPGLKKILENVPTKKAWGYELPVPMKADVVVASSWGGADVSEWDEEKSRPILEMVKELRNGTMSRV